VGDVVLLGVGGRAWLRGMGTPLLPWIPMMQVGITGGSGVRTASLWAGLLGIEGATVKAVELDPKGRLRVAVLLILPASCQAG
jgi:hypothetical protein